MTTTACRARARRRGLRRLLALVGCAAVVTGSLTTPSAAELLADCQTPVVRETMVSQGLPTYGTLVRGKSTLVKYFLSTPNGCDPSRQHLTVTGGTLSVSTSLQATSVQVGLPAESHGPISPYSSAPAATSTGNPTFLVRGGQLGPADGSAPYTSSFSGSITYTVTDSAGVTGPPRTLALPRTDRTVNTPANPMRILVVPIGDAVRSFDENFPVVAQNHLASAMATLGRLLPVADGVGGLDHPAAGIRYEVARSDSLVDVGPHDHDFDPTTADQNWLDGEPGKPTSRYCPSSGDFPYLSAKLASARETWNRANPESPASRVLGVLWQDISRGASTDDETTTSDGSCVEGYAGVPGTVAWSRIVDPHDGNPAQSSGSIAAMELMHTLGAVPNALSGYHSKNSQSDSTAPDRAYDVIRRSHIALDKSVMRYFYDAWHDDITLLEPNDWAQASCVLSANAAQSLTATACSEPATAGAVAHAAADRVHLAGKTDGTPAGTHAHTYVAASRSVDSTESTSPFQLVYYGPGRTELDRTGVRVVFEESEHAEEAPDVPGNHAERSLVGIFDVAVVPPAGTVEFALVKRGQPDVVLYGRDKDQRPAVTSVAGATDGPPRRYASVPPGELFPVAPDTAVSEDGSLIAWETEDGVNVRRTSDLTSTPLLIPDAKDPSFAHTRSSLVFATADGAEVHSVDLDTSAQVPTRVGSARVVYRSPRDPFGNVTAPVESPAYSPTDDRVVLASEGWSTAQLYVMSANTTCTLLGTSGCTQLTTAGHAHEPSWGRSPNPAALDGVIAFTDSTPYDGGSSSAVATINPIVPAVAETTRTVLEDDAASPDWGGDRLAWTALDPTGGPSNTIVTVNGLTFGDRRVVTPALGEPSLSGNDQLLAFTLEQADPRGGPPASAIFLKSLASADGDRVVQATDDSGRELRLDVLASCGSRTYPLLTDVGPTLDSAGTATFQVAVETAQLCPGAVLRYEVTDGFQISEPHLEPVQADGSAAAVGVLAPRPHEVFLQHRSVPVAVNGRDSTGAPAAVTYTVTGPGTSRTGTLAAGDRDDLAAFSTPGDYTLVASVGGLTTSVPFTVVADADADGIPAEADSRSAHGCLPLDADLDPRTAIVDYDGDFLVGADDPAPCVSAHNVSVDLDANTLQGGSAGTKLTVYVTSPSLPLNQFTTAGVAITRLAGHHVSLPALSWSVTSTGQGVAKFNRQDFQQAVADLGLTGFVPVLVEGRATTAAFSGVDPSDPTIK